jgi:hypothetical protein
MLVRYPTDIPVDSVKALIADIKNKTVVTNRAAFGENVWNVQGYLMSKTLGETPNAMGSGAPTRDLTDVMGACPDLSDDDAIAQLETLCAPEDAKSALPWPMIVPLLKWLLKISLPYILG